MWCVVSIVLYILGGALEVVGILLVVAELRANRRRALEGEARELGCCVLSEPHS